MKHFIFCLLSLSLLVVPCSSHGGDAASCVNLQVEDEVFPFPSIPSMITAPEDRAAYLLTHYWDEVDFERHILNDQDALMEQGFVDFLSVFPYASAPVLKEAVRHLLKHALVSSARVEPLMQLVENYLYHPNSPMLNEGYYQYFVEAFLEVRGLPLVAQEQLRFHLSALQQNRVGTPVADFILTDPSGKHIRLHRVEAPAILLFFYDAECDECQRVLSLMCESGALQKLVTQRSLKVVTVCVEGEPSRWRKMVSQFPDSWVNGRGDDDASLFEKFTFRALPSLYLLDENKKVLYKDVTWRHLETTVLSQ